METPNAAARPATEPLQISTRRKVSPSAAAPPSRQARPEAAGSATASPKARPATSRPAADRPAKDRPAKARQAPKGKDAPAPRRATPPATEARSAGERRSESEKRARRKRPQRIRTSTLLRQILTQNPSTEEFTIEHIVQSMHEGGLAQPLLLFSVPGILPVPETGVLSGFPASAIAGHMIVGRGKIELPQFIRERTVPRRSLAVAIHAIIPVLERLEKATKQRWLWMSHPIAQRMLGVLLFVLAVSVAFPFVGFTLPHAAAMFTITLGVAEQDGLAILLGVAAGIAALVLVSGRDLTFGTLRGRLWKWLRGLARKLTGTVLKKLGFDWGHLVEFQWNELLLLWNPEKQRGATARAA